MQILIEASSPIHIRDWMLAVKWSHIGFEKLLFFL